jgi:hypothetical protein
VVTSWAYGRGHALKVTGQVRRLWIPRLVLAAGSVFVTLVLARRSGVDGASAAVAMSGVAYLVTVWLVARPVLADSNAPKELIKAPGTSGVTTPSRELS